MRFAAKKFKRCRVYPLVEIFRDSPRVCFLHYLQDSIEEKKKSCTHIVKGRERRARQASETEKNQLFLIYSLEERKK